MNITEYCDKNINKNRNINNNNNNNNNNKNKSDKYDIDNAWEEFLENGQIEDVKNRNTNHNIISEIIGNVPKKVYNIPKDKDLYISTKTKIAYLSHPIELFDVFWEIPINPYSIPKEGIIKKQIKYNFTNEQSLLEIQKKLEGIINVDQHIINQIVNPEGRIKFKDIRKISIGLCNKDIISYRSKKKSAFYNCFVVIIRVLDEMSRYKEIHVKVFNTGKLEIPGIRCNKILVKVMNLLVDILKPITGLKNLECNMNNCETVLINSNFNCGFYINREKLLDILKYKYQINCIFDSCQYPGIQCKYSYTDEYNKNYKISFMIFRTGSVLIVGKCDEDVLNKIYTIIKDILIKEYYQIFVINNEASKHVPKKKKNKKKFIEFTN
jgi:hypothetical protein